MDFDFYYACGDGSPQTAGGIGTVPRQVAGGAGVLSGLWSEMPAAAPPGMPNHFRLMSAPAEPTRTLTIALKPGRVYQAMDRRYGNTAPAGGEIFGEAAGGMAAR